MDSYANIPKYILFCAQEANFQTRMMYIPFEEINLCPERKADLETLRNNSQKNVNLEGINIDNLVYDKIYWKGNQGKQESSELSRVINDFVFYAEGLHQELDFKTGEPELRLIKEYDIQWVRNILEIGYDGFDHVGNYNYYKNLTSHSGQEIDVVEGFIVLQEDIREDSNV